MEIPATGRNLKEILGRNLTELEARLALGRSIDKPYEEKRWYSVMERRAVQIANLQFKLELAEELGLNERKINRMKVALERQLTSQSRYRNRNGRDVNS